MPLVCVLFVAWCGDLMGGQPSHQTSQMDFIATFSSSVFSSSPFPWPGNNISIGSIQQKIGRSVFLRSLLPSLRISKALWVFLFVRGFSGCHLSSVVPSLVLLSDAVSSCIQPCNSVACFSPSAVRMMNVWKLKVVPLLFVWSLPAQLAGLEGDK